VTLPAEPSAEKFPSIAAGIAVTGLGQALKVIISFVSAIVLAHFLRPQDFGLGVRIVRTALDFARADPRISVVTFLVPPSRRSLGALVRMGARQRGSLDYGGARFLKYSLETPVP